MADILKTFLIFAVISICLMSSDGSDTKTTKKGNPTSKKADMTTKNITAMTKKPAQLSNSRKPPSANKDPQKRAATKAPTIDEQFEAFKKKYNKTYSSEQEEAEARKIFEKNMQNDQQHNKKKSEYRRGTNAYSDKSHDWKVKNRMGAKKSRSTSDASSLSTKSSLAARMGDGDSSIPDSANWTDWNSPVKDQADCGACWIFAPLAILEYLTIVIRENLTLLSEQEVLDCNTLGDGCDGGWPTEGFNYIISNGLTRQKSYPYVSYQSDCLAKRFERILSINETYEEELNGDEDQLKFIVYTYGPTVVVIYASEGFTQYAGGVFLENDCPNDSDSYNHAIVVVGYGTDPEAGDFWIIKNSWGDEWGEYGYGRIARNRGNMCGIANYAMNPSSSWISVLNFNQTKNGKN